MFLSLLNYLSYLHLPTSTTYLEPAQQACFRINLITTLFQKEQLRNKIRLFTKRTACQHACFNFDFSFVLYFSNTFLLCCIFLTQAALPSFIKKSEKLVLIHQIPQDADRLRRLSRQSTVVPMISSSGIGVNEQ